MPTFFATAAKFRAWLAKHGETAAELVVGYRKVDSGIPSLTWPESVDEALCYGWIDGIRKRIDDTAYQIRFTPRRKHSIWSNKNIARVEELIREGRMTPRGLEAFERRKVEKSGIYLYEKTGVPELTADEEAAFRADSEAWAFYQRLAPSHRKRWQGWITGAKKPETRASRLARAIATARQRKML